MSKKIVVLLLAILFLLVPVFSIILPVYASTGWGVPMNITSDPNHNDMQSVIAQDPIHKGVWQVAWAKEMTLSVQTSWEIYYRNSSAISVRITNDQIYDWNPMIDMDSKGIVHIVWVRQLSAIRSDIFYANSANWNNHINISKQISGDRNWDPTLVVDKITGIPHIAWVASQLDLPGGDIWYSNGTTGPITPVVTTNKLSIEPSIALDTKKNVHLVWVENGPNTGGTYQIRYTNSTVWPVVDNVHYRNVSVLSQTNFRRPDIAIDTLNRTHVAYYSNISSAFVWYTFSPFPSNSFFLNPILASPNTNIYNDKNPSIKVSKTANPIIIYQGLNGIAREIYATDYNSTWAPTDISNNAYIDSLEWSSIGALDIDANDNLYATYYTYIAPAGGGPGSNWEVFVVIGSITGAGVPGFEFAYLLVTALAAALVWYYFKRKSTTLLSK